MRWLYRLLIGSFRITFLSSEPERVLNFALKNNIPIWRIQREEGKISFSVLPGHRVFFKEFFSPSLPGEAWQEREEGSRILLRRFGSRWGLFLGGMVFLLALVLSTRIVWSVEVDGNALIPENVICQKMEALGLKPGVSIGRVDPGEFSLLFQVKNPEFSFASLNIIGTRAILSVREREEVEEEKASAEGVANLVASVSGKIVRYEILSGQLAVKRGDVVPKGALLVSGIVERPNGAFKTVSAKGRVFAETERYFEVTVPFSLVKESYTGREEMKKQYQLLWFSFAPLDFDTSPYERSHFTEQIERLCFLGRELPILCQTRTYYETEEKNRALTVDSAKNLAYDKYETYKRENLLPGYEMIAENATVSQTDEAITLSVELSLVEDIAAPLPFSYTE